jgi:Lrp/AsnC family transcriptional regulator, leucine-responsive regulatory protein
MAGIFDKIDELDVKILKILQEDSSISNLELSGKIGLSPTPTFERVKKLEKAKVIRSYRAELDPSLLGFGIQTFMLVSLSNSQGGAVKSFIQQVSDIDEIIECYHITGSSDYLFKILVKDIASYEYLAMEKIRNIKEISSMKTMVILSTIKKSNQLPINLKQNA